jgi:hypothetical protein
MTALIVGGLVVVVLLVVVWLRLSAARSDSRSMETYGHALGVLGDVAKRTGPSPSVRVLPRAEPGRTHVRTGQGGGPSSDTRSPPPTGADRADDPGSGALGVQSGDAGEAAPARAYRRPSVSIPVSEHGVSFDDPRPRRGSEQPVAGDHRVREPGVATSSDQDLHSPEGSERDRHEVAGVVRQQVARPRSFRLREGEPLSRPSPAAVAAPAEPESEVVAAPAASKTMSPAELRRQATVRRIATTACAAVAVVLIAVAAIELSGSPSHTATPPSKTKHHGTSSTSVPPSTAAPSTTAKPAVINPTSTSGNEATFPAPSGTYVLTFATSDSPCWVGVESAIGSGDFLWTDAVQPGISATYKASGSLAVNVGAAQYLSVRVNGEPIRIPSSVTTGYLSFASP